MTTDLRLSIHVPDHEVLRKIGGGAYGEVWLARGVTGAWRAVKVVWRQDFDDERGFEREFDGILQYEPISRDHPCLVNILHVGRSKAGPDAFYYYVMELGDDYFTGVEINPVEYEARTLRSDLVTADGTPLDLDFCLDVAIQLGGALGYLHERGLAHRDVKPSNVIFVGGKAKLADIGLVAPRDQRTFVGTEGFVPPEGPGSAQADLYSLGKVLYEMMTGKDRLQFPELPDTLPSGAKRKIWLEMNQVLCDICEPKQAKRKITTAVELVEAVRRVQLGKKLRKRRSGRFLRIGAAAGVTFIAIYAAQRWQPWKQPETASIAQGSGSSPTTNKVANEEPSSPKYQWCSVKVITQPPFATVYENGVRLDLVTPLDFRDFPPGQTVRYRFEYPGFESSEKSYLVPDQDIFIINETLKIFRPPVENVVWIGPFGDEYLPGDGYHISRFLRTSNYESYLKHTKRKSPAKYLPYSERGERVRITLLTRQQAQKYAQWLEDKARDEGLIRSDEMIDFKQDADLNVSGFSPEDRKANVLPTRMLVKAIPYGAIEFASAPSDARIYVDGAFVGRTPYKSKLLRPRKFSVEIHADGYQKFHYTVDLSDRETFQLNAVLKKNNGVVFGRNWRNSLDLLMVPIGDKMMASAYETRVADYKQFAQLTKRPLPGGSKCTQAANHPIVGVSREDAIAFCLWLTKKERESETIGQYHRYKLPSDLEWSTLSGFSEEKSASPSERDRDAHANPELRDLYFWGRSFPPNSSVANLADEAAAGAVSVAHSKTIEGYFDGFEMTAPVGSFAPNKFGLFDLCGNAYEWVEDDYSNTAALAVARGGCWATYTKDHLRIWSRFLAPKSTRGDQFGFRVILVDESQYNVQ